jgi:photosystem II stability/assembly factor-like uncharacterized protein
MSPALLFLALSLPVAPQQAPAAQPAPELPVDAYRFRSLGPATTSGRVVGFAVHPDDRAVYYVAVASGGVWKTTNAGTTFSPIFDGEGSYSIGCITMDPSNPNTLWVGTGENNSQRSVAYGDGVYKSIDGGRSWQNVGLKTSEHIGKIIVHPKDPDTVYVAAQGPLWSSGGERGLYKTTDGGKTWKAVLTIDADTGVTDFTVDPTNPDVIVAASYQRRRHVWTIVNGGPGSAIHRSTDGGKSWKKVTSGLPGGDLGRIGLAQAPTDPKTLYTIIEGGDNNGGIFRSTDGGLTWEKRNPFDSQAQYYSHLVVDPVNKERIYVMNVIIQVSDDGGKTLTGMSESSKHVDNHTIWIDPKNPKYYLVGCDGGIYESHDAAGKWHFKGNLPVTQFYDIGVDQNPKSGKYYHVYGGTQDNFTLGGPVRTRSENGIVNADWYVVQGGDGFHCKVDPEDPNIVYGEYQYGGLCRFDRRTGNRVDIRPMPRKGEAPLRWNWDAPLIISPHKGTRLYYAANRLFRSDDRGNSWVPVSPDLTRQLDRNLLKVFGKIQPPEAIFKHGSTSMYGNIVALAESQKKEGLIYVGTDDGLIQVTDDGGKNWRKIEKFPGVPERTYVSKIITSEHDAETVFAAFDNHKNGDFKPYLLKSTDAGKTWASLASTLPERGTVYAIAEDHVLPELLFCGTEFGLFCSGDTGKNWVRMRNGLPTIQVKDLVIQKHNNDLIVGTFGRGLYVLDDYSTLRSFVGDKGVALKKEPAAILPPSGVYPFVPSSQFGGSGKGFQGDSLYSAENPPVGATFTLHIKEGVKTLKQLRLEKTKAAEKAGKDPEYPTPEELRAEVNEVPPSATLSILREGEVVAKVSVPARAGVHRVTWNLREFGTNPEFSNGGRGPLALPGKYQASLSLKHRGKTTVLTPKPVDFELAADPMATIKTADLTAQREYLQQLKKTQIELNLIVAQAAEIGTRIEQIRKSHSVATKPNPTLDERLEKAQDKLKLAQRVLFGDRELAAQNLPTSPSIRERLRYAANVGEDSGEVVFTATAQEQLSDAREELAGVTKQLKELSEKELPALEKLHAETGALPLPARSSPGR